MVSRRIPVSGPAITQKEIDYVMDAVQNAWYSNANMYHEKFERKFAEYIGVNFAIALPSCTSAIHLSLLAAGIGPGDEVIVPDITWIASAAPIEYVGATPIFVDIDPKSWCMDAASFKNSITPRTKAVIPVDLYGNIPDMDQIIQIAHFHNIFVIEDAAEAIGSSYKGRQAGSFGNTGVFSFHGSKTMTTGEGGMLVTNDKEIYKRCLFLRDHGRIPGDIMFNNNEVAYKYKMSSMQAALGLAQLERISELIEKKREIFYWYQSELGAFKSLKLNDEAQETVNTYWMVTIIIDKALKCFKNELITSLSERNIDSRPFFNPLSSLPAYNQIDKYKNKNTVAYSLAPYGVNLPCGLTVTQEEVKYVCESLVQILQL